MYSNSPVKFNVFEREENVFILPLLHLSGVSRIPRLTSYAMKLYITWTTSIIRVLIWNWFSSLNLKVVII